MWTYGSRRMKISGVLSWHKPSSGHSDEITGFYLLFPLNFHSERLMGGLENLR